MNQTNPTFPPEDVNIPDITFNSIKNSNNQKAEITANTNISGPQRVVPLPSEAFHSILKELGVDFIGSS